MDGAYALDLTAIAILALSAGLDPMEATEVAADIEPYIVFSSRPSS
jgi:hypothetical protein